MTFKQIELAIDLSHTLNYRQTAENQYISQPSLTYQIKSLEAEIGVPLFRRSSSGVSLTPAGAVFCRDMATIAQKAHAVLSTVRNCGSGFVDTLRIGINGRRHPAVLAEVARRFAQECPDVFLDLVDEPGPNRLSMFLRRELDGVFFVSEAFSSTPGVEHITLMNSRLYCVMRRDHPLAARHMLTAADLAGQFLLLNHSSEPAALDHAQTHLMQRISCRSQLCTGAEIAFLWIEANDGISLMPGFCHDGNDRFAWVPFDWRETIPCSLAWHAENGNPIMRTFAAIAAKAYADSSCL